jgi:hypothetical protein
MLRQNTPNARRRQDAVAHAWDWGLRGFAGVLDARFARIGRIKSAAAPG